MKVLIFAALFLFSNSALSSTQVIFEKNGTKALVLLSGGVQDTESRRLYDLLTVPEVEMNGKLTKTLTFTNSRGERALQVSCVFSKFSTNNGRCTVTFYSVTDTVFDSKLGLIQLIPTGPVDAQGLASYFSIVQGSSYLSEDSRLQIQRELAGSAEVGISLVYRK